MTYQHHVTNSYGFKYDYDISEHRELIKIRNANKRDELIKSYVEELEDLADKSTQLNKNNIIMTNEQNAIVYIQLIIKKLDMIIILVVIL